MPEERLQRGRVSAALAQEAIGEAVPQLMRSQRPDPRSLADTPNETPEGLFATRSLRILAPPHPRRHRRPLLDLRRENVVVRLRLQLPTTGLDFAAFVIAASQPADRAELPPPPPGPPTEAEVAAVTELAAEHGIDLLGPPGALPGDAPAH